MKRIAILAFLTLASLWSFGQAQPLRTDPSYSASNYKHSNKAAKAAARNLDHRRAMESVVVWANEGYKHPLKRRSFKRATVGVTSNSNAASSHKHPLGL